MIQTEPIGSIPRPPALLAAMRAYAQQRCTQEEMKAAYDDALHQTIAELEATGSPVITDGEQTKPSFATYPLQGLTTLGADGVIITFADGHQRRLPRLTGGPFRYGTYVDRYGLAARRHAHAPIKQAVISVSALSLLYPDAGISGYPREHFLDDLLREAEVDIRRCLNAGAHAVQIDFTEGRLAVKLDPSGGLLKGFIDLNNRVLSRFSSTDRVRIGIHTCPGGDHDSTHSADVDYGALLPHLFDLQAGKFYIQLASERDRISVLKLIKRLALPHHTIFVGVIDPLTPRIETAAEVRDRVLEAASFIPIHQLGTTDDCGFSPFGDDTSTTREIAFAKIRARVAGTAMAARQLGTGEAP